MQKPKEPNKETVSKTRKLCHRVKECKNNRKYNQKQPESEFATLFYQAQVEFEKVI